MDLLTFSKECHDALLGSDDQSLRARTYLESRGLSNETIEGNIIGFCSKSQSLPTDSDNSTSRNINETLRGKIVVPIFSEFGGVVGVACRNPNPAEKGWWNNKFKKERHIFLFDKARRNIFDGNKAYVFEGYFDAIVLHQFGLKSATCVMGTNIGYRRIGLYARYCDRICLCFDNDANDAGLMGQLKTVADLNTLGFGQIFKIDLPQGVDPDEFVIKYGLKEFLSREVEMPLWEIKEAGKRYLELREYRRSLGKFETRRN